jgi:hypothetical protein
MASLEQTVREAVEREVAPLIATLESLRATIDRTEAALPLLEKHERDAARVDAMMRRARLQCLLVELRGVEERILHLAKERWPQWRT